MINDVRDMQISRIFDVNTENIFSIPKYQRQYTWGKVDWDALFTDVIENEPGYFLGSFICVSTSSLNGNCLDLIDGQQRFTTVTLLLAALYEKLAAQKDKMDEEERSDLLNLRKEIAIRKDNSEYIPRLNLQKQNSNDKDYEYILYSAGIISSVHEKTDNFGYRRIGKAYKHFCDLIDEEVARRISENESPNEISALLALKKKFEKAILVGIQVDSNKDAYMLFESLNHRGVPLSALDLIKNSLIAKADSEAEADNSYEKWGAILNLIGSEDYSMQERFFANTIMHLEKNLMLRLRIMEKNIH